MKIPNYDPCKNFTEILARSRQSRRDRRDLGEIASISARFQNIAPRKVARGEIAAISPRSRLDRQDLREITTISARFRNIASRYLPRGEIVTRSRHAKPVRGEITAISALFQNITPRYLARSEPDCNTISPRQTSSRRDSHNLGADSRDLGDFMSRFLLLQRRDCLDLCKIYLHRISISVRFLSGFTAATAIVFVQIS